MANAGNFPGQSSRDTLHTPQALIPRDAQGALPVRAPGRQHLFRHGAAVVSGKAAHLGRWLQHLQSFMADNKVTEVLMFFTQKFAQLDGPVNFTLTTLTDLAWTLLVLVWEAALDGKLPFLKEVETRLHDNYVKLQEQFFACRTAWLHEISQARDKTRDKKLSPAVQEALHQTIEEDIYQFIPQQALDGEHAEYFVASVKEGVKLVMSRREDKPGTKDEGSQTKGGWYSSQLADSDAEEGEEGLEDDESRARNEGAASAAAPRPRHDLQKRINDLQKEKDMALGKAQKFAEDAASIRKNYEKLQEKYKESEYEKKLLQEELDKVQKALEQDAKKAAVPQVDLSGDREQGKQQLERKVWDLERKLAHSEVRVAELEAQLQVALAGGGGAEKSASKKGTAHGGSQDRIAELEEELQKLKDDRAHLQENFLHMMEEHEETLLRTITTEVLSRERSTKVPAVKRAAKAAAIAAKAAKSPPHSSSKERPPSRSDVIPCGVSVDSGVQSVIRDARLERKYDRGEDHSGSVSVQPIEHTPSSAAPPSSPRHDGGDVAAALHTRDDDRASRWIDKGPTTPDSKHGKRKQQHHTESSPPHSRPQKVTLQTDKDAPGYELLAEMRHEVGQRRTDFVAKLKEMYTHGELPDDDCLGDGFGRDSLSTWAGMSIEMHHIATQTYNEELKDMPVVGTQLDGGGFVGGELYRPDHSGRVSDNWKEPEETEEGMGFLVGRPGGGVRDPKNAPSSLVGGTPMEIMQAEVQQLRETLAEEQLARQRADLTLSEMATRVAKLQQTLKKRGVEDALVQESMAELGLDGLSASLNGCRAVFIRLHKDALERRERLFARQKEAYDRMQKRMEMDSTFRLMVGLPELQQQDGEGSASVEGTAFAMRKTMEAFSLLREGSTTWSDPLEAGPSQTLSELSTVAWISDPQVLPFLERDLEIAGLGFTLSPRRSSGEMMGSTLPRTATRGREARNAQGWPRQRLQQQETKPLGTPSSPRSSAGLAGRQSSTGSLAQMSTQQLDDGVSSMASLSFLEGADSSPSASTLRCASQSSTSVPESQRKLLRNKQRLVQHGAEPNMTFEEYCRRSQDMRNEDEFSQAAGQRQGPKVLLSSLKPVPGDRSRAGTALPQAERQHAATYHFDTAGGNKLGTSTSTGMLPDLRSTSGAVGKHSSSAAADQLWRTKSQPVMRYTTSQEPQSVGLTPIVKIRGSKR
mmetsp:Transcript_31984/g.74937  ORF Transcript_31984/g.74937 Transcript_31984/m.74937 type:complete len:1207 (+) Transcript_31984:69-3689(+)